MATEGDVDHLELKNSLFFEAIDDDDINEGKRLLGYGADINFSEKTHERGATPLHYCLKRKRYRFMKFLVVSGASVNALDEVNLVQQSIVAKSLHSTLLQNGCSPLHQACRNGDLQAVTILLGSAELDPDAQVPKTGFAALHFNALQGNPTITEALLRAGADCLLQNLAGETALHVAAKVWIKSLSEMCECL